MLYSRLCQRERGLHKRVICFDRFGGVFSGRGRPDDHGFAARVVMEIQKLPQRVWYKLQKRRVARFRGALRTSRPFADFARLELRLPFAVAGQLAAAEFRERLLRCPPQNRTRAGDFADRAADS